MTVRAIEAAGLSRPIVKSESLAPGTVRVSPLDQSDATVSRVSADARKTEILNQTGPLAISLVDDGSDVGGVEGPVRDESPKGETTGDGRGVIRLLESGHFRGVADVRLRINFFDELSTRAQTAARPIIESATDQFTTTVGDEVLALAREVSATDATGEVNELLAAFEAAVREGIGEGTDAEATAAALQSAFDELVAGLRDALSVSTGDTVGREGDGANDDGVSKIGTAPVEAAVSPVGSADVNPVLAEPGEPVNVTPITRVGKTALDDSATEPTTDDVPVDPPIGDLPDQPVEQPTPTPDDGAVPGESTSLDDALAALTAQFEQALQNLLATMGEATRLSDPTPAKGNGKAYDKFLAEYNALRGENVVIDQSA